MATSWNLEVFKTRIYPGPASSLIFTSKVITSHKLYVVVSQVSKVNYYILTPFNPCPFAIQPQSRESSHVWFISSLAWFHNAQKEGTKRQCVTEGLKSSFKTYQVRQDVNVKNTTMENVKQSTLLSKYKKMTKLPKHGDPRAQ